MPAGSLGGVEGVRLLRWRVATELMLAAAEVAQARGGGSARAVGVAMTTVQVGWRAG